MVDVHAAVSSAVCSMAEKIIQLVDELVDAVYDQCHWSNDCTHEKREAAANKVAEARRRVVAAIRLAGDQGARGADGL